MLTGLQIRSARAALRWSVETLAEHSGVSVRTILRMETNDGEPTSTKVNIQAVKTALEAAGIEFIGTPEDRPGVRFGTATR